MFLHCFKLNFSPIWRIFLLFITYIFLLFMYFERPLNKSLKSFNLRYILIKIKLAFCSILFLFFVDRLRVQNGFYSLSLISVWVILPLYECIFVCVYRSKSMFSCWLTVVMVCFHVCLQLLWWVFLYAYSCMSMFFVYAYSCVGEFFCMPTNCMGMFSVCTLLNECV